MRRTALRAIMAFACFLLFVSFARALSSSWLYAWFFQPTHQPISFSYILDYNWEYQNGASIRISTVTKFTHFDVTVLYDLMPLRSLFGSWLLGWAITPYAIYDPPGAHPQMVGPATVEIPLGEIKDGNYVLKIRMSGAVDTFYVRKTAHMFSIEEGRATNGKLVGKNEFETRLDGFRVEYVGYPEIDNGTKQYIIDRIARLGGVIQGTENGSSDGWVVYLNFLYSGDVSNLNDIITHLPANDTRYWIRIESNTGWFSQVS